MNSSTQYPEHLRLEVERYLETVHFSSETGTAGLDEAMRYSLLAGGKRIRPVLALATAEAIGRPTSWVLPLAAAIELIHTYSLIHDDLPAMDDDDLRRGQPTCHRAFDEGTAILAGDALQALAFAVLASQTNALADATRVRMLTVLADAIGLAGMAGGQAIDLEAAGGASDPARIELMHRRKTGALIRASVELGALAAGTRDDAALAAFGLLGEEKYLAAFRRAHAWFHGENSLRQPLVDTWCGACFDGLQPAGVNRNQGAESTLAYLWVEVLNVEVQQSLRDGPKDAVASA